MAHSVPAWRDDAGPERPPADDRATSGQEPGPVPLWLAHLRFGEEQKASGPTASDTSITIELDKADYEALSRTARLTGNRVSDLIHAAVQREIGNKPHVITLMHRWNLHREDLDRAAGSLGVDPLSEREWGQIGIRGLRRR
ncbi:hypothetical protein ACLQ2R_03485 [Streptosporangium sp. DT93]|uniref:hypothetical protein n=1 Tax=Streptosporangium sp. DT93 TaxID=3393428 RepID=UPI003CE90434